MIKYTPAYLKKLEDFLEENEYEVRYEKGNFKSGYCLLEAKRMIMINKFSPLESRINSLLEIINYLKEQHLLLSDKNQLFLTENNFDVQM